MRILAITAVMSKFFKEIYRNKISIVLLLLFPMFFLFIFNMAFGSAEIAGATTYQLAIINQDQGIPQSLIPTLAPDIRSWGETGVGANLTSIILDQTYNDSGHTPIFQSVDIAESQARTAVNEGDISVAMIIPENYSMMVLNQINVVYGNQSIPGYPTAINATFDFLIDENDITAEVPVVIIKQIINTFHQAISSGKIPQVIDLDQQSVIKGEVNSIFDFIASGLLVFASILAASFFSALLLVDQEQMTITRIRLSIISPQEYVIGFMAICFFLTLVQNAILLLSAVYLFGYDPVGSLARGYVILNMASLPMFALVFTAGAIFKTSDTAGNAIGFSSSILGFASNAFFQMPDVVLIPRILSFTSGSPDLLIWDLVPWNHAVNAMRTVMLFDKTLVEVGGDLLMLAITSLVWLGLAMYFYGKKTFALED